MQVICTYDFEEVLQYSDILALVIPSQTVRENVRQMAKSIKSEKVVSCFCKGLEKGTGLRMSQVIQQELPKVKVVAMSGPCHAEELAAGIPTAYVAASGNEDSAKLVQDIFMSSRFRVYTNSDITGVELGGAVKNIIAICARYFRWAWLW